jgi:2'-5' RNA ligase
MTSADQRMINHWWWRPGWRVGRSFYTWHVTFEEGSALAGLADRYRDTLQKFPSLDVLSTGQLHLTMQGIGFTDEVSDADVADIVTATQHELAALPSRTVQAGPPYVDAETVQLALQPVSEVDEVRAALRRGIAAVWGAERVPEPTDGYRPHVSLAYSNAEADRAEIAGAVQEIGGLTVVVRIDAVSLIRLNRDQARYDWTELAVASLHDSSA